MNREDIYNIVVPIAIAIIGTLGTYFFHNINEQNSGKSNEENLLEIKVLNTW